MDVVEVLMYFFWNFVGGFIVTVLLHERSDLDNVLHEVLADGVGHVLGFQETHGILIRDFVFFTEIRPETSILSMITLYVF